MIKAIQKFYESLDYDIKIWLILPASLMSLTLLGYWIKKKIKERNFEKIARKVLSERDSKIESFLKENSCKITREEIDQIIRKDVTALSEDIKDKKISSEKVVLAYIIRTAIIGKELNLIANINFDEAMQLAKEADEIIAKTPRSELPPLIGVPVSIKDLITVANVPTTLGLTSCHNLVKNFDSLIVSILRKKGAIPFVISNVPQALFSVESSNYLWGCSQNPWNRKKTTGGSSGGEAGLIAAGCSPFGIGSDFAGSIRIPSSFCGIYGFKPTTSRISLKNVTRINRSVHSSILAFDTSLGPMCKSARDLITITSNLFGNFQSDPYVDNAPYDLSLNLSSTKKIKIGYLIDSPLADAAPDIRNKIEIINKFLSSNGYEVVPFNFPKLKEFSEVGFVLTLNYGLLEVIINNVDGEKLYPSFKNILLLNSMPMNRIILMSILLYLLGEKRVSYEFFKIKRLNRLELLSYQKNFEELKCEFIDYFINEGFDALITPVFPCPSFDIGLGADFLHFIFFCSLFNYANMPCASIPVALCEDTSYVDKHNDLYTKILKKGLEGAKGLPFGIQIATLPKQDEKCLLLSQEIDKIFDFGNKHSHKVLENLKVVN